MDEIITSDQGTLEYSKKLNSELLQPNQISQGLYKCSPLAKQLLAYVIADLKIMKWSNLNIETYETTFKTSDFNALAALLPYFSIIFFSAISSISPVNSIDFLL